MNSKKYTWYQQANPMIAIEQQMMDRLAIEIRDEIDKTIIEALRGEHYSYDLSPVKDGTK